MVQTFRNKFQTSEIVTCISVLDYVSKFYLESEAGYIAEKQEINKLTKVNNCLWNAIGNLTSDLEPDGHTWIWHSI